MRGSSSLSCRHAVFYGCLFLVPWFLATQALSMDTIAFTDITAATGLGFVDDQVESVAWGDYDNDGDPDLYLTFGRLLDFQTLPNRLYRNDGPTGTDGAMVFTDVTDVAGVGNDLWGVGTAFGDLDNDGDLDLYGVNFSGQDVLYRNNGPTGPGGAYNFTDVTVAAGITNISGVVTRSSRGMAMIDYNRDGLLDIYVNAIGDDLLYRNDGNLQFTEVAASAGITGVGGQGVGVVATDINKDGYVDLFTGNRSSDPNTLFLNNGDGTFTDITAAAGITEIGLGMGVISLDYDNDLDFDLYWTTWPGAAEPFQANAFYRNNGDATPTFTDVADTTDTTDVPGWGISANAGDIDNDGWMDFLITNGFDANSGANVLYRNNIAGDGTFEDVTSSLEGGGLFDGRGVAFADIDLDGDLDVIVTGDEGVSTRLWRNDSENDHHWITLKLEGVDSNRSAIGARIEVTTANGTTTQEVSGGAGRGSANDPSIEFGLDDADEIESITIYWPSGIVQELEDVSVDQILAITETSIADADYNNDGTVDTADYTMWRDTGGATVTPGFGADGTGDGIIDYFDYDYWSNRFGQGVFGSSVTAVPEPATWWLALAWLVILRPRNLRMARIR